MIHMEEERDEATRLDVETSETPHRTEALDNRKEHYVPSRDLRRDSYNIPHDTTQR